MQGATCFQPTPLGRCGNSILELANNEECDGGLTGDACCNIDCTLKAGAVCDDGNNQKYLFIIYSCLL